MDTPSDQEYMHGLSLALAGETEAAIAAFRRSMALDPNSIDPALSLLDAYTEAGRLEEADDLAALLVRRWPEAEQSRRVLARLRERQGRVAEALDLIQSTGNVREDASSHEYPIYLRLLLAAGRFQQAAHEALRGLETIWRTHSLLALGLSKLQLGDEVEAVRVLGAIDVQEYRDLIAGWAKSLSYSGAAARLSHTLHEAARRHADPESLTGLAEMLDAAAS